MHVFLQRGDFIPLQDILKVFTTFEGSPLGDVMLSFRKLNVVTIYKHTFMVIFMELFSVVIFPCMFLLVF